MEEEQGLELRLSQVYSPAVCMLLKRAYNDMIVYHKGVGPLDDEFRASITSVRETVRGFSGKKPAGLVLLVLSEITRDLISQICRESFNISPDGLDITLREEVTEDA